MPKRSPELSIQLKIGSAGSDPQWKIDDSCPFYDEIQAAIKKSQATSLAEGDGYQGYLIHTQGQKDCSEPNGSCVLGVPAGTNRGLEIMLLHSAPDSLLSKDVEQMVKNYKK